MSYNSNEDYNEDIKSENSNKKNQEESDMKDQSINERNKIVDEFMNYIDNKNNIKKNWEDEEEDDFDKIENEYMRKKKMKKQK